MEEEKKNESVLTAEDVKELTPLYSNVILALKQVYDPEIPVNIYDLGLIYDLTISKSRDVYILMTFTAPNCPMADQVLRRMYGKKVRSRQGENLIRHRNGAPDQPVTSALKEMKSCS